MAWVQKQKKEEEKEEKEKEKEKEERNERNARERRERREREDAVGGLGSMDISNPPAVPADVAPLREELAHTQRTLTNAQTQMVRDAQRVQQLQQLHQEQLQQQQQQQQIFQRVTDAALHWQREATRRQVEANYACAACTTAWELGELYQESARLVDIDKRNATRQHQLNRARQRIKVIEQLIIALDASERETKDKYNVHTLARYDDPQFEVPEQAAQQAIANLQKQRDVDMKAAEDRYTLHLEGTAQRAGESGRFIVQATQAI